ncbi:MAG: UDP-N-acetylmuramoyl-L-alanine--D-glutamate ligase, partial [Planctomycetaceae bacterium]|nr:UDP-N-acetylmuramoyl-L-alanine--D-glutamate ligase [Planctomycetaceae bacterium]
MTTDFHNRRVTVMGLGRFGGGLGAVRFLAERGARVTVTDLATEAELVDVLSQLDGLNIDRFRLGEHVEDDFRDADLVVVNPAVPPENRFLDIARRAGVPLSCEMNLFWQFNRGKVVAVTGSNGKSTTTAMIHSILNAAGLRAWLGGNIGKSLLPEIDNIQPDDWCVLELSSFQLEELDRLKAAPDVAVVTNFSPNHLDRHKTLDAYRQAKQSILRWQSSEQVAILNGEDADVRQWPTCGQRWYFGGCDAESPSAMRCIAAVGDNSCDTTHRRSENVSEFPLREWLTLPGEHNLQNATAAAAAALAVGVSIADVQTGLERYQALPHRLQFVAEVQGRKFYNDSLATTPESVTAALSAFDEPVVLLAGGYDKQVDLAPLAETIAIGAKAVALMGQTAEPLRELLAANATQPAMNCLRSFDEAFAWAVEHSSCGDVVLLSPGCASYDWFPNFAKRGERFVELVHEFKR